MQYTNNAGNNNHTLNYERLAKNLVYMKGLSDYRKIQLLKLIFHFKGHVTYKQLRDFFECGQRTAYRYTEIMRDMGLAERIPGTNPTVYKINSYWR